MNGRGPGDPERLMPIGLYCIREPCKNFSLCSMKTWLEVPKDQVIGECKSVKAKGPGQLIVGVLFGPVAFRNKVILISHSPLVSEWQFLRHAAQIIKQSSFARGHIETDQGLMFKGQRTHLGVNLLQSTRIVLPVGSLSERSEPLALTVIGPLMDQDEKMVSWQRNMQSGRR